MTDPQLAQAFRAARKMIARGGTPYICYALSKASWLGAIVTPTYLRATHVIHQRLAGHLHLEGWVSQHVLQGLRPTKADMLLYRLRWLDHLIQEFEEELSYA